MLEDKKNSDVLWGFFWKIFLLPVDLITHANSKKVFVLQE